MEYLCTWYTVAYWVLKVNTRPFFTGTRALVHRSKVWATAKIPLAVWQPATIAFLYVCMSSPLSVQKKGKKTPDRKLALWVQVMVIYAVQMLYSFAFAMIRPL